MRKVADHDILCSYYILTQVEWNMRWLLIISFKRTWINRVLQKRVQIMLPFRLSYSGVQSHLSTLSGHQVLHFLFFRSYLNPCWKSKVSWNNKMKLAKTLLYFIVVQGFSVERFISKYLGTCYSKAFYSSFYIAYNIGNLPTKRSGVHGVKPTEVSDLAEMLLGDCCSIDPSDDYCCVGFNAWWSIINFIASLEISIMKHSNKCFPF